MYIFGWILASATERGLNDRALVGGIERDVSDH